MLKDYLIAFDAYPELDEERRIERMRIADGEPKLEGGTPLLFTREYYEYCERRNVEAGLIVSPGATIVSSVYTWPDHFVCIAQEGNYQMIPYAIAQNMHLAFLEKYPDE